MKKNLTFLFLALLFVSCSNVLITGRKQLNLVSDQEMLSLSAQNYKQYIDSMPASKDYVNTLLIRKVGGKISKAVEEFLKTTPMANEVSLYQWEFNLINDTVANAFCMPGGKVVFFEGILPFTKDETGIAVVMGHEIAHAVAKHSSERLSQQMLLQYGAMVTDLLAAKQSTTVRGGINTLYGIGSQVGVILPYSRKHEYEADRMGLVFMAMAGYNPEKSIEFWERMAANGASAGLELLSTHPSDENRIAQMKTYLPEAMKYYQAK